MSYCDVLLQNLPKANFRTKGGKGVNQVEDLRRSSFESEGTTIRPVSPMWPGIEPLPVRTQVTHH